MIHVNEGLGGWTIIVKNGHETTRLECSQYIVKRSGINWFDFDKAMRDARRIDGRKKAKGE